MASQTFNNFKNYANQLEAELGIKYDAKPYKDTIRVMLDGYCKAMDENDEHLKNLFISGLILRHWDKVKKLADSCPNIDLKGEEFVDKKNPANLGLDGKPLDKGEGNGQQNEGPKQGEVAGGGPSL